MQASRKIKLVGGRLVHMGEKLFPSLVNNIYIQPQKSYPIYKTYSKVSYIWQMI